jgi:hypothetical protein
MELDPYQFKKRVSAENEWITSVGSQKGMVQSYKFYDYAPIVFQRLRHRHGIKEENYMHSLGPEQILSSFFNNNYDSLYELCSSGQSGSLFYYTHDKKYMLKTIPEREFDSLRDALPAYYKMMKQNTDSLISRFYGLHRVVWTDKDDKKQIRFLVVMNNVFKDFKVGIRFDLKGSTAGRDELEYG